MCVYPAFRLVWIRRLEKPFDSEATLNDVCWALQHALDSVGRPNYRALVDSRRAVGRNDDRFERWFAYHRRAMVVGFARSALLVQTAVGQLHIERLLRDDGLFDVRVFTSEVAALAFLTDGAVP